MQNTVAVILAAGMSKRMKTKHPKVLHLLAGRRIIEYVLDAVEQAGINKIYLVVGFGLEKVGEFVKDRVTLVEQKEQFGTGHAVQQVAPFLSDFHGDVLVLCGDMPIIDSKVLKALLGVHRKSKSPITMLTAEFSWESDLGRVVRNGNGLVERIVEMRDATLGEAAIREVNLATYVFCCDHLLAYLPRIGLPNAQREIYLTDIVLLTAKDGLPVQALLWPDPEIGLGINSRADLAQASHIVRRRILKSFMEQGVTIEDPQNTYIDARAMIGMDTTIRPYTLIEGICVIGEDCQIGPFTRIADSTIAAGVTIQNSVVMGASIGEGTTVGPYAYLRPGTVLGRGVRVGDFVEIKKSRIDDYSRVPHLSYIGDATIGSQVNVGAGVITCNFDGEKKHPTVIEDEAYIGANTNLVAPVRVGRGSRTGAGAVVTEDVPPCSLAVGVPAKVKKVLKKQPSG